MKATPMRYWWDADSPVRREKLKPTPTSFHLAGVGRRVRLRPGAVRVVRPQKSIVSLAEIGQRVKVRASVLPDALADSLFKVTNTADKGVNGQFVELSPDDGGTVTVWVHADDLTPAPAPLAEPIRIPEEQTMKNTISLTAAATAFDGLVRTLSVKHGWAEAFRLASDQDEEGARAYRAQGLEREEAPAPQQAVNLSTRPGETFDALARRIAHERGISLRDAVHAAGLSRPELVAGR